MTHRKMIKYLMTLYRSEDIAKILHCGKSIVYLWADGKRKPSHFMGIAIEELYKNSTEGL